MNTPLMLDWLRNCFATRGPYFLNTRSVLVMDHYGSHIKEEILKEIKRVYKTEVVLVPKKCTFFAQPLDVALNNGFKAALRKEWDEWFKSGPKEYTTKGYRKRPSYQV